MSEKANTITKGRILVYRAYDVGEEIDLEKAEKILAETPTTRSKFRLKKMNRQAVIVSNDPLAITLGQYSYTAQGREFLFEMSAKLWDFGSLSLTFDYTIPEGTSMDELRALGSLIQEDEGIDEYARNKALEISHQVNAAIGKVNEIKEEDFNEDYILYFIEKFSRDYEDATAILQEEDIASLILSEEKGTLGAPIYDRLYETKLQYYKNDLAVIDWNSAFIIEPSGSLDIPDVIEFALNQLLEMRFYDGLLDKKLREIYSAIELKDMSIFSTRYTDLALEAGQRYIEIAEIVESVENSLKVIGDLYHATVFRMASKKFRFSDWQGSIDNKLENLAEICKLLLDHINHRKSHLLELTVIALISLELIPLFEHIQKLFK